VIHPEETDPFNYCKPKITDTALHLMRFGAELSEGQITGGGRLVLPAIRGREKRMSAQNRRAFAALERIGLDPKPGIFVTVLPRESPTPACCRASGQITAAACRS